ncbi:MAG TPA: MBL fold metallo-hydrolase [Actinomycetota bacterium]|nr:MBL fold metallo-hydrolase [Actinomycetota bacterium]
MMSPLDRLRQARTSHGVVALTWLGQAGFAISAGGRTALVDPFLSGHEDRLYEASLAPTSASGVDVVLCTHEHIDHFDAETAPAIAAASPDAVFVVPTPILDQVTEAGVAADRVLGVQPGERHEVAGFSVEAVPACHGVTMDDAYGFGEGISGGEVRFLGYVVDADGVRLYHAGDTILYEGMEAAVRRLGPDVALLPVNGRSAEREARGIVGNLNEEEAPRLAADIGADTLVPMHHDMIRGNLGSTPKVVEAAEQEARRIAVLVPSRDEPFVVAARRQRP